MELQPLETRRFEAWRRRYLEQLGVGVIPDFHEALCRTGRAYGVSAAGRDLGYVILTEEVFSSDLAGPVIPEFHLSLTQARSAKELMSAMFERLRPGTVIGRTDDRAGFPLLMDLRLPNRVAAPLYILDAPPPWREDGDLALVESTLDDLQRLQALYASVPPEDGGIPDAVSLVKSLAAWRHYRLLAGGEPVGVAYVVPQGGRYVTVAAIVAEGARGRGYGRYLVSFAVRRELAEGKTVIAAVNPDNEPARRLTESLGARLAAHFLHFTPAPAGVWEPGEGA